MSTASVGIRASKPNSFQVPPGVGPVSGTLTSLALLNFFTTPQYSGSFTSPFPGTGFVSTRVQYTTSGDLQGFIPTYGWNVGWLPSRIWAYATCNSANPYSRQLRVFMNSGGLIGGPVISGVNNTALYCDIPQGNPLDYPVDFNVVYINNGVSDTFCATPFIGYFGQDPNF